MILNLVGKLFSIVRESVFSETNIPTYSELTKERGEAAGDEVTNKLLNFSLFLCTTIMILGLVFAPYIVKMFAIGYDGDKLKIASLFMRAVILTMYPNIYAAIFSSYLQIKGDFITPALPLLILNIILGITVAISKGNIYIMAIGIFLAYFIQFAIFPGAGVACRIGTGEYRDIDLVGADGHFHGDVQIPHTGRRIVDGCVRVRDPFAVRPDLRHIAAFRDIGVARDIDCAARLIQLYVGAVGNVERSVISRRDLIMSLFRAHFLIGGAVARNEFILAVHHDIGMYRNVVIDVSVVLALDGHAGVICAVFLPCVRFPGPVAGGDRHTLGGRLPQCCASRVIVVGDARGKSQVQTDS